MDQINRIERSEIWKQIHDMVKQIPRKEISSDAPDAPSVATDIEELFLKLLPIQNVSKSFNIDDVKKAVDHWGMTHC